MTEVFKDINGYEGLYQVSNLGNVKSLNYLRTGKERILKPGERRGYLYVTLCKDIKHKNYDIQRLVADAFIPNPLHLPCINHKDENKHNNFIENLEWCTYSYNNTYNNRHLKVAEKQSIAIYCVELNKVFPSTREACRITGIHHQNINKCLKGRYKTAGGFHWTYA